MTDVFGRVHLGYLVIETEKFDDWRRFGRDAIGIDLDARNVDLARERVGMFLTDVHHLTEDWRPTGPCRHCWPDTSHPTPKETP